MYIIARKIHFIHILCTQNMYFIFFYVHKICSYIKTTFLVLKTLLLHLYEVKPKFGNNQWGFLYTTKGCEFNFVHIHISLFD